MKIRVVELLATLRRAGAERMAVSLACRLDPDRFETAVISLYDAFPGGLEAELKARGVPVLHLGKHSGLDLRMYPRLIRVFRKMRPAVIHSHSYVLRYGWPAAAGGARGAAMVHTVHNVAEREAHDAVGRVLQRLAFRRGVVPVTVAAEVARSFRKLYGFEPGATIPNGIDAARFQRPEARAAWRRDNGFTDDDLLVVSVARLEPQKNPLGLIDAFSRISGNSAHLVLAGDGSLREAVRGRGGRVRLAGVQSDIAPLLAAADIFALASHWEGNPMAVMEAMAAGLPVVATAVGGVPELVEQGVTGLLVPPGDAAAFARALDALLSDAPLRRRFGEAASERAGRFSVDAMVAAYADLFERLAGGSR